MSGLSPVPRDQCSTPQLDLHVMYSTFRTQPPSTSAGIDKIFKEMMMNLPNSLMVNSYGYDGSYIFSILESNPDPEMSQDSNPGNGNYMRGEV